MSAQTLARHDDLDVAVLHSDDGTVTIHGKASDPTDCIDLTHEQATWLFRSAGPAVLYEIARPPLRRTPGSG
jgi:hypothetical protein